MPIVIKRIPAWSSNATTRAIVTPKLLVVDSGLGGRLTGLVPERALDPLAPVGPLLENFAVDRPAAHVGRRTRTAPPLPQPRQGRGGRRTGARLR
ncbi:MULTISPECIES: DUF4143 domain-containing protein [unclassified Nonomuraea]|uniref:DUF4143 domain-containing protein n=1 Tax=unclassified Nonomuraea TaxID=2593643 RepID=UPI0033D84000